MRAILARLEQISMNAALLLFLLLCAMTAMNGGLRILLTTRNIVLLLMGLSGIFVAGELSNLRKVRLSRERKRMLFIAEYLLLAFSLVLLVFALFELGLVTGLSRWD